MYPCLNNMIIKVRASAGAKTNELTQLSELEYKIKVTAPREHGKANNVIIKLLSEHLNIPKSRLTIKSGLMSKVKLIEIS